jgi:peptide deformylase
MCRARNEPGAGVRQLGIRLRIGVEELRVRAGLPQGTSALYMDAMAILKIARMGHPVLVAQAEPVVDPGAPDLRRLIRDMLETMVDAQGIGLAAPQVHESRRVIVFLDALDREEAGARAPVVLINPELEPIGPADELGWEGCLSIPGLRGVVPRHARIRYRGLGIEGEPIEREAGGLHARVVQHEVDHLNGVLYPMRMVDLRQLAFESELRHFATEPDRSEQGG